MFATRTAIDLAMRAPFTYDAANRRVYVTADAYFCENTDGGICFRNSRGFLVADNSWPRAAVLRIREAFSMLNAMWIVRQY